MGKGSERACRFIFMLVSAYATWGFVLLLRRLEGQTNLGDDPRSTFEFPRLETEQSCPAGGGGGQCRNGQWWARSEQALSSPHFLQIDTMNFNSTVVAMAQSRSRLLIAYFDPRSQSFGELKPDLEEAAEALSLLASSNASVGRLGACDVTVNTYLGTVEAPELYDGWQEGKQRAFRFGRPRFFPLILVLYEDGARSGEYTGVVKAKPITTFLQRLSVEPGGQPLQDSAALELFLESPGPFALACGLLEGSTEWSTFQQVAKDLRDSLMFGVAASSVCQEAFGQLSETQQVVWVDNGQKNRVRSSSESLLSPAALAEWLSSQRHELFEEMTPDTSHKYLDRPQPLLILLVDPADKKGWERGSTLVASVEDKLGNDVQLVWSDCREFGPQFGATGKCPVFVAVETKSMKWHKASPLSFQRQSSEAMPKRNASERFLDWLQKKTGFKVRSQKERANSAAPVETAQAAAALPEQGGKRRKTKRKGSKETVEGSVNATNKSQTIATEPLDARARHHKGMSEGLQEDFLETMPELDQSDMTFAWSHYVGALTHLLELQRSFEARYGQHLKFDFSDLQRAQKLHPAMRSLGPSPSAVRQQVQEPEQLQRLRKAIEWQASFEFNASHSKVPNHVKEKLEGLFLKGYKLIRDLFLRLFRFLHSHAAAGTLGVPQSEPTPVERRSALQLSVREFVEKYARPGRPVIITDLNITEEEPWTLDFFKQRCNVSAALQRKNALKWSWGRLEEAGELPLPEFIESFKSNQTRRAWYLHDWSLPKHCPAVFGPPPFRGFTVPKYFAGDYFQRAAFDGYQHSWPSLFIGSEQTESAMHIDSGGTNFWLYLLSGKKEWRFFSHVDLVNVYQSPLHTHFLADAFHPDAEKFPLLKYAEMFVGIQKPGEIIFIPGGNPHAVRNLEPIHGVSMNYVDATNVWTHLWHMLVEGKWLAFEMFTDGVTVPHGMLSEQESVRFGVWKSTKWKELKYDLD